VQRGGQGGERKQELERQGEKECQGDNYKKCCKEYESKKEIFIHTFDLLCEILNALQSQLIIAASYNRTPARQVKLGGGSNDISAEDTERGEETMGGTDPPLSSLSVAGPFLNPTDIPGPPAAAVAAGTRTNEIPISKQAHIRASVSGFDSVRRSAKLGWVFGYWGGGSPGSAGALARVRQGVEMGGGEGSCPDGTDAS
jgi:hypothetical protein